MSHAKSDTYQAGRGIHALEENMDITCLITTTHSRGNIHAERLGLNETTQANNPVMLAERPWLIDQDIGVS